MNAATTPHFIRMIGRVKPSRIIWMLNIQISIFATLQTLNLTFNPYYDIIYLESEGKHY